MHHIFPKAYLKKNGIDAKGRYNQVANFTYLDTQVNKAIGDAAPAEYFAEVIRQCCTKEPEIGNITDMQLLEQNIRENALPFDIIHMTVDDYDEFLNQRRHLMANMIEEYYKQL